MKIGSTLDSIGKNLSRIKTVAIFVLIIFFSIYVINNGCDRTELENVVEEVTGLNIQNHILHKGIKVRDSLLRVKNDSILALSREIERSKEQLISLDFKYGQIRAKYDLLSSDLIKLSDNESYVFLDRVAYPYSGLKQYSFNGPQIKGIHKTYLEHESLLVMNKNLLSQKEELIHQVILQESKYVEASESMMLMKETREDQNQIIENKDKNIELTEKQLKKVKRKALFGKIGIGLGALILGFLAGS